MTGKFIFYENKTLQSIYKKEFKEACLLLYLVNHRSTFDLEFFERAPTDIDGINA